MFRNSKIISLIIFLQCFHNYGAQSTKAICIVPVADLVGRSLSNLYPKENIAEVYSKIPVSDQDSWSCFRLHQCLFNEIVDVIEEKNNEIKVNISSVFYQTPQDNNRQFSYWALKQNFILLQNINNLDLIPRPIDFKINNNDHEKSTITLILPFFDSNTKKIFSAGTRFIFKEKKNNQYITFIYNPETNNFIESLIPETICIESIERTKEERIKNFVQLVKLWSKLENKIIPYVLGGSSLKEFAVSEEFRIVKDKDSNGKDRAQWIRKDNLQTPFSGFDCSTLVARATQICQIPYFFKNTTTAMSNLKTLAQNEPIINGDLIWFRGHLIIITDVDNNLCVESRGYSMGYAKVQEIHINKIFKNIENIELLRHAFFNNISLQLLNKDGNVSSTINNFKILKLDSTFIN